MEVEDASIIVKAPRSCTSKKRVRWSTITIHEFGVGYGGSAVPKNGPSIGLSKEPEFTWSTRVGEMAKSNDGVCRFTSAERIELLRNAGYGVETIDFFVEEAKEVRESREFYCERVKMERERKKRKKQSKANRVKVTSSGRGTTSLVSFSTTPTTKHERNPSELLMNAVQKMGIVKKKEIQQQFIISQCCS
jgi:hypothetical protein